MKNLRIIKMDKLTYRHIIIKSVFDRFWAKYWSVRLILTLFENYFFLGCITILYETLNFTFQNSDSLHPRLITSIF